MWWNKCQWKGTRDMQKSCLENDHFACKSLSLAFAAGIEKKGTSRDHTTTSFWIFIYIPGEVLFFPGFQEHTKSSWGLLFSMLAGHYLWICKYVLPFIQTSTIFSISRCWGERRHWCPLFSHRGGGNGVGPWLIVIVVSPLLGGSGKGVYPRLVPLQ